VIAPHFSDPEPFFDCVSVLSRRRLSRSLFRPAGFGLALTLTLGACGNGVNGAVSNTGGADNSGGQAATGGGSGQTGGNSSTGGRGASGGAPANAGGTASGGDDGASTGGTGGTDDVGSGGAANGACTRELLDGLLDDYFAALSAGDASSLPLAADVKFTENAEEAEIGSTEFWMNAGDTKHSQRALDTEECSAAAQAVVPEGGTDLPVAVRLKVDGGELTEIETIVVRPGDYTASFAVASNPGAIIDISEDIGWHDVVPEGERATREELISWMDKYFRAFPQGVCDVTQACIRLENGGGNFNCGESCGSIPGNNVFDPRIILADVERGIAVGFTIFDFMTVGHLDMHMMKMSGGEVHAVHAMLRDTNGESGWE